MLFFFAGLGTGYKIPVTILILYLVLYFGKEQFERIVTNKDAGIVLLYLLSSLVLFIGILYSDNIKIPDWREKYTITLFHLFILFVIFVGEGKKYIPLLLLSFIAGFFAYIISTLSFELFFNSIKYRWEVLINPFAWKARSTKYLLDKIEPGLTVATVVYLVFLLKKILSEETGKYLKKEYFKISMLILLYFLLGLGVPHAVGYSLPVTILLVYLVIHFNPKTLMVVFKRRSILYFYILSISYFASVYILGKELFNDPHITNRIYISILYLNIFLLLSINENWKTHKFLILSYLFGIFCYSAIVVGYSAWLDPVEYGYKKLFNPFSNSLNNSPIHSNFLALGFSAALVAFLHSQSKAIKLISSLTILLSTISVLTIAGRTFLLITIFSTIVISLLNIKNKYLPYLLLTIVASVISTVSIYYFILPDEAVTRFDRMFIARLEGLLDFNNPRYRLWIEGYFKILENPSGSFIPEDIAPKSKSFHNVWIDTVKYGGWLSLWILICINCYWVSLILKCTYRKEFLSFWFLSAICLLLLAQDVVLESKLLYIFYAYSASIFFLLRIRNKYHRPKM
jgi:hypothetical protein